ncbi:MAG: hypothetical protein V4488_23915 [Pseudomonadota bacterium]
MLISGISSSYADKGGVSSYPSGTAVDAGNTSVAAAAQQAALEQAASAGVVAALASSVANAPNAPNAQTYTAAGLLDGNAQAANALSASPASGPAGGKGAESAAVATVTESVLQQAIEKEIVASLSAKAVGAGVYNGMGVLESLPFSRVTDLGSLLRYNPQLSFIRVGDSYNQGLIESLDIIA